MSNIIEMENVYYSYPKQVKAGTYALKNINLNIKQGEFLVIMGANGAGKTSLCLTLNGIIPSSSGGKFSGFIKVEGKDTIETRVYELAESVGMVLQNPEAQLFMATLEQELAFGPENLAIHPPEIMKRIKTALKQVRLEGMDERSPNDLSGGQKQRAAVAAALTMEPKILVLDEPTSQLDPVGTTEVFSVVKELNQKFGMTIIMAEHKSEEIAEFADRIIVLEEGEVVADGDPYRIYDNAKLMDRIHVKIPQVSRLCHNINDNLPQLEIGRTCINIDEMVKTLKPKFESGRLKVSSKKRQSESLDRKEKVVLETKNLWHIYEPNIEALKGVDLQIHEGDFVGIIGQNGAGKTTLVKHFLNLLQPTKGEVLLEGKSVTPMTVAELATHIGLILQNPDHQLFSRSVYKEVTYGPNNLIKKRSGKTEEIKRRAEEAMEMIGVTQFKEEHPLSLSWGDRQKVAVAAVLSMMPQIVIFDEPTTGMDYLGRYQILNLAKLLNERGHTIVAITHDMELVAEYAKWTVIMGEGEILYHGPTHEAFARTDTLSKTFLKAPQITTLASKFERFGVPPGILTTKELLGMLQYS